YWIGWDQMERIEFHAPESPFDLLWRRTHMEVKNGPDGEVFLPATYVDTPTAANDALRLGRATDWRGEEENLVRGVGQRTLLVGDDDRSLMEIQLIEFNAGEEG
ncbi:MAG: type VI secretion system accessory protein TagJ, partial [Pirellulales bacterium]